MVEVSYQGQFAVLYMNAGENRFNLPFVRAMHRALDDIEAHHEVTAVITTSRGKFYSNGLDLAWISKQSEPVNAQFVKENGILLARMLTFPFPTVAAINGHAFAAGAIFALAHDYRVMRTKQGWISLNEIFIDRVIAPGWMDILTSKITDSRVLREAILFGRRFTAEEGVECNIIDICVPQETLLSSARALLLKELSEKFKFKRSTLGDMKIQLYRNAYNLLRNTTSKL